MNEVSQGEAGNMEYVEFVVVDTSVTYDCASGLPPSIDIRGWIFDDNSGYHGSTGVAAGAVRFSFDNTWAVVPLGTIILIYNDADPNPELPADDISMSDGNCQIVAPISNTTLFESNATTPGAIACSYPATGWTPGGDWSNTLLRNGGDCARIVDLSGCEVFSVCWGDNNLNTQIYFAGGATSATSSTNTVYYFNDVDPEVQANWSIGCADPVSCGVQEQTPGAPNNALNAAFISAFNNGCSPIPPISASAVIDNEASCDCDAQATAIGSGSIPGYTYLWMDNTYSPIGQTDATAIDLCGGTTYYVEITSSIGCIDTAAITLAPTPPDVQLAVSGQTICAGEASVVTVTPSDAGDGEILWSPGGETTSQIYVTPIQTTVYTVTYTPVIGCPVSADVVVTVANCPDSVPPIIDTVDVSIEVPNVFTPNNDGTNEFFGLLQDVMSDYHVVILNRWGEVVLENIGTGGKNLWDGRDQSTGINCVEGVYFFQITGTLLDGEQTEKQGFVHLIRSE